MEIIFTDKKESYKKCKKCGKKTWIVEDICFECQLNRHGYYPQKDKLWRY